MRKIFFLIFLISTNSFSQKCEKLDFSISEIDNLCRKESCLIIHDLGGKIESEILTKSDGKEVKISGNGYEGIKTHSYSADSLKIKTLTVEEKKKYDESENCKFIRADYQSKVTFENGNYVSINAEFYYNRNELFYVKYQEINILDKTEYIKSYNLFTFEFDNKLNAEQNLKKWIIDQNQEIIKKCINQ